MSYSAPLDAIATTIRATGSYVGTGATLNINVGFQPKYIHIMNLGVVPAGRRGGFKTDSMSGNNAVDHGGDTAVGVTITTTGFTLDTAAMFNTLSDVYTYIAIK